MDHMRVRFKAFTVEDIKPDGFNWSELMKKNSILISNDDASDYDVSGDLAKTCCTGLKQQSTNFNDLKSTLLPFSVVSKTLKAPEAKQNKKRSSYVVESFSFGITAWKRESVLKRITPITCLGVCESHVLGLKLEYCASEVVRMGLKPGYFWLAQDLFRQIADFDAGAKAYQSYIRSLRCKLASGEIIPTSCSETSPFINHLKASMKKTAAHCERKSKESAGEALELWSSIFQNWKYRMDELEAFEDVFETLKSWTNVHCKKEVITEPKPQKVQKEESFDPDWQYDMRHRERGCFVIFNQKRFDSHLRIKFREHNDSDAMNLKNTVKKLGFEHVCIINDAGRSEILHLLKILSKSDHSDYDCFGCAILTHGGDNDDLFVRDAKMNLKELTQPFHSANCPSLAGKPKMFFIQACRGYMSDDKAKMRDQSDVKFDEVHVADPASDTCDKNNKLFTTADFLIANSAVPEYYSWRNKNNSSIFIQSLCIVLNKYGNSMDLLQMLIVVNRLIAKQLIDVKQSSEWKKSSQIPFILSMLTSEVYFATGEPQSKKRTNPQKKSGPQKSITQPLKKNAADTLTKQVMDTYIKDIMTESRVKYFDPKKIFIPISVAAATNQEHTNSSCVGFHEMFGVLGLKRLDNQDLLWTSRGFRLRLKECLTTLAEASHPNVLRLFGFTLWKSSITAVTEYPAAGNLEDLLFRKIGDQFKVPHIPALTKLRFCTEIIHGIAFLHSLDLKLYSDLRPRRIMLTDSLRCKISYFDGAYQQPAFTSDTFSSYYPEILEKRRLAFDKACDIYSFGLLLYVILTRRACSNCSHDIFPEGGNLQEEDIISILRDEVTMCRAEPGRRPMSLEIYNRLSNCLSTKNPCLIYQQVADIAQNFAASHPYQKQFQCVPLT
ncbi:uncharacterized protein LOC143445109 [Clavelina lepadiformis]|uniref:uncharacterized protein LOC143445109 n=1 Tax=Clavelina lepadiformis TaxID=159417 RepID=UPI0040424569